MLYGNWIAEIVKRCQRRFDEMVIGNNFEYGPEFEIAIAKALRDVLPARCGVCRGYIVEQSGKKAGDDIIIYDRARFQTLHALGDDLSRKDHVPFEAVLVYIEAKHTLKLDDDDDRQSLMYASKQIAKVRELRRELVRQTPGVVMKGYAAPGFPKYENPLYCAIFARYIEPASGTGNLSEAMRRVRAANVPIPDLVAAGRLLSVPACYAFMNGRPELLGTRPFLAVDGNRPLFSERDDALGIALVHMMSSIDLIELGSLPWGKMIHGAFEGTEVSLWGPDEAYLDPA